MEIVDDIGQKITLDKSHLRCVSLVPSITELLVDLGVELIGRTKFCIHPASIKETVPQIGGTKNPRIEDILGLDPEIIIANKEENRKEDVEALARKVPVFTTDVRNLQDNIRLIDSMAQIFGKEKEAEILKSELLDLLDLESSQPSVPSLYMIWKEPWMAAGGDSFIDDVMQKIGLQNVLQESIRYPSLKESEIQELNPSLVLLSSEPYPFGEKNIEEIRDLLPQAKVILVDGEAFSWYGSRIIKKAPYLSQISKSIHEEISS